MFGGAQDELAFKDYLRATRCRPRSGTRRTAEPDRAEHREERADPRRAARRLDREQEPLGGRSCDGRARPPRHPGARRPRLRQPARGARSCCCDRATRPLPGAGSAAAASVTTRRRPARRASPSTSRFTSAGLARLGLRRRGARDVLERVRRRHDDAAPAPDPRRHGRERARALGLGRPERPAGRRCCCCSTRATTPAGSARHARARAARRRASRSCTGSRPPISTASSSSASATGSRSRSSRGSRRRAPPETTVKAGEFVLGYLNEYGLLHRPAAASTGGGPARRCCRATPQGSGRADLGRNGSYLVFRQLRQDVPRFWRFADGARGAPTARDPARGSGSPPRWSAAGRAALRSCWRRTPTIPRLAEANDFGYHEHDRRGDALPGRRPRPPREPARLARPDSRQPRLVRRSTGATGSCAAAASTARRSRSRTRSPATTAPSAASTSCA